LVPAAIVGFASLLVADVLMQRWTRLRLDPTHGEFFVDANAHLDDPQAGDARVVLLGDSRFAQWSQPLSGLGSAQIVNRAFGGDTTAQALLRLERDVLALAPDAVVIQAGINDLQAIGIVRRSDWIVRQVCENLETMVKRLRAARVPVVITTVFPVGPVSLLRRIYWSDDTLSAVTRVNARIRRMAGPGVLLVDADTFFAEGGRMKDAYAADHFHLTAEGYRRLETALLPALKTVLDRDAVQ
jgi:lysophospholipase L1-like esterase